jgi:hypothetical protein
VVEFYRRWYDTPVEPAHLHDPRRPPTEDVSPGSVSQLPMPGSSGERGSRARSRHLLRDVARYRG